MTRKIECDACGEQWTDSRSSDRPYEVVLRFGESEDFLFRDLCVSCMNKLKNNIKEWMKPCRM
jgi:hypothetical protein